MRADKTKSDYNGAEGIRPADCLKKDVVATIDMAFRLEDKQLEFRVESNLSFSHCPRAMVPVSRAG